MDVFHASSGTASTLKAERSASLKHLNEGPLKDSNVHPRNKSKNGDRFRDVEARSARLDANRSAMPPSTSDSAARVGVAFSAGMTINTRASSRPKRPLQPDAHEASQSSGAHLPPSVPASMPASAAPASVPADFIEKIDSKSGRHYWVNLKTKTRSWAPPDAGHARDNTAVTPELSTAGGTSSRNVTTLERRMPGSNDGPSSNDQGNQSVNSQPEEALHSAAPPVQRDNQKSASVRHQDDTQNVHTMSAQLSASTLAAERMRRQNLADLAATGANRIQSSAAVKLGGFIREVPKTHVEALPKVHANETVSIELEEVAVHTAPPPALQQRQDNTTQANSLPLAGFPGIAESGTITNGQSSRIQDLKAGVKASAVIANPASVRVKRPTHVTDAVTSGSSQPEAQRHRDPIRIDAPPFDDDDLKLAKRREEKAAARAAQRSLMSTLGARGSKPLHRNPDKERE
jgi:hypothetical protein